MVCLSASICLMGAPFIFVDKKRASVLVFEVDARLRAHSAVLLGSALGDDSVPGIGTRPMAQILAAERTTPAGRFVAERAPNSEGEDVVWVGYAAAVSMHRVRTKNPRRAAGRTPGVADDCRQPNFVGLHQRAGGVLRGLHSTHLCVAQGRGVRAARDQVGCRGFRRPARYGLRTTRRIVTLRARKSGRFAGEVPRCATAQSAQPRHPMMVHVPTPADTTGCPYRP